MHLKGRYILVIFFIFHRVGHGILYVIGTWKIFVKWMIKPYNQIKTKSNVRK